MHGSSNDKIEIAIDEPIRVVVNGSEPPLASQIEALKTRLENEIHFSRTLKMGIVERDQRIAVLEDTLTDTRAKLHEELAVIRRIRTSCEEDARQMTQIKALQTNTLDMRDSNIRELMDVMDGVEEGVRKIYLSRRWRFANIILWVKGLFRSRAKRPFRGYWRIDAKMAEYRVWRDRYLSKND
ncbi:MAG TPA: hypothetical protein VK961_10990 [Chthoniobacter sp.]|nr:hypothetical protein [Chthoniobacter sp.]